MTIIVMMPVTLCQLPDSDTSSASRKLGAIWVIPGASCRPTFPVHHLSAVSSSLDTPHCALSIQTCAEHLSGR